MPDPEPNGTQQEPEGDIYQLVFKDRNGTFWPPQPSDGTIRSLEVRALTPAEAAVNGAMAMASDADGLILLFDIFNPARGLKVYHIQKL